MANDLLNRISSEVHERLCVLRPAVEECERLQAYLRAIEGEMETGHEPIACEPLSVPAPAPESVQSPREPAVPVPVAAPAPPVCAATRARPLVSPKVLRLMGAPGAGPVPGGGYRRVRSRS